MLPSSNEPFPIGDDALPQEETYNETGEWTYMYIEVNACTFVYMSMCKYSVLSVCVCKP